MRKLPSCKFDHRFQPKQTVNFISIFFSILKSRFNIFCLWWTVGKTKSPKECWEQCKTKRSSSVWALGLFPYKSGAKRTVHFKSNQLRQFQNQELF